MSSLQKHTKLLLLLLFFVRFTRGYHFEGKNELTSTAFHIVYTIYSIIIIRQ